MMPVPIDLTMLGDVPSSDLRAIAPALAHAYRTRQIFRTDTEAEISVLNDLHFPTNAAKYWQAVREQCVMVEQLALLSFDWRRNELLINRLQQRGRWWPSRAARIDLDECLFKRANMTTIAADRVREICMWERLKRRHNDNTFSVDDVNEHQLVSYTAQFALRALTIDQSKMSGGEMDNLMGQLRTALDRAAQSGVIDKVKKHLPETAQMLLQSLQG